MNRNDSDNHLGVRTIHKCRKKRKRSKHKGCSTKKCQKTVVPVLKQHSIGSVQKRYFSKHKRSKDNLFSVHKKIMSSWYWHNYNKAMAWRSKHNVAYWKAYALSLQNENKYLLGIVQKLDPGKIVNISSANQHDDEDEKINDADLASTSGASTSESNPHVCEGDEFQFEMSEEMMSFFEQSFKHKMDLKKARDNAEKKTDGDSFLKVAQKIRLQREEEMKSLYGDGASMIVGMETAVQLSFERYCDTKSPKYWPNIPLRL